MDSVKKCSWSSHIANLKKKTVAWLWRCRTRKHRHSGNLSTSETLVCKISPTRHKKAQVVVRMYILRRREDKEDERTGWRTVHWLQWIDGIGTVVSSMSVWELENGKVKSLLKYCRNLKRKNENEWNFITDSCKGTGKDSNCRWHDWTIRRMV